MWPGRRGIATSKAGKAALFVDAFLASLQENRQQQREGSHLLGPNGLGIWQDPWEDTPSLKEKLSNLKHQLGDIRPYDLSELLCELSLVIWQLRAWFTISSADLVLEILKKVHQMSGRLPETTSGGDPGLAVLRLLEGYIFFYAARQEKLKEKVQQVVAKIVHKKRLPPCTLVRVEAALVCLGILKEPPCPGLQETVGDVLLDSLACSLAPDAHARRRMEATRTLRPDVRLWKGGPKADGKGHERYVEGKGHEARDAWPQAETEALFSVEKAHRRLKWGAQGGHRLESISAQAAVERRRRPSWAPNAASIVDQVSEIFHRGAGQVASAWRAEPEASPTPEKTLEQRLQQRLQRWFAKLQAAGGTPPRLSSSVFEVPKIDGIQVAMSWRGLEIWLRLARDGALLGAWTECFVAEAAEEVQLCAEEASGAPLEDFLDLLLPATEPTDPREDEACQKVSFASWLDERPPIHRMGTASEGLAWDFPLTRQDKTELLIQSMLAQEGQHLEKIEELQAGWLQDYGAQVLRFEHVQACFMPIAQTVPEFTFDLEVPFFNILVPTVETTMQRLLVENLMRAGYHVLFSGPVAPVPEGAAVLRALDTGKGKKMSTVAGGVGRPRPETWESESPYESGRWGCDL
ncbi:unnamed protein product [Effrenium voratum]|nr:unnamed protein product [Effrenium voratum]